MTPVRARGASGRRPALRGESPERQRLGDRHGDQHGRRRRSTSGSARRAWGSSSSRRSGCRVSVTIALKCQVALSRQGIKLAKLHHGLEATCRLGVIKAEAAGNGTAKAEAACLKRARSRQSRLQALARAARSSGHRSRRAAARSLPRDLNAPCARGAAGFGDTADCSDRAARGARPGDGGRRVQRHAPGPARRRGAGLSEGDRQARSPFRGPLPQGPRRLSREIAARRRRPGRTSPRRSRRASPSSISGARISKAAIARERRVGGDRAAMRRCDAGGARQSPCDPAARGSPRGRELRAARITWTTSAKLIAAEFNDACVIFTRIGLASAYPRGLLRPLGASFGQTGFLFDRPAARAALEASTRRRSAPR